MSSTEPDSRGTDSRGTDSRGTDSREADSREADSRGAAHSVPDACPGALTPHPAADGPLARVRLPGGRLTPAQLHALAEAADELGNGALELTSRGNVQLRAITDLDALADRLRTAGLLPGPSHERVRNIVASPLSGRVGGRADVRELVAALDDGLCARPELAALPGRVLFTLDDGRGDVAGLGGDIGLHALGPDDFALALAGRPTGLRVSRRDAVGTVLDAAAAFQHGRGDAWRLAEVPDGVPRVLRALGAADARGPEPAEPPPAPPPPIGWLDQDDGLVALGAGVRLGTLDTRVALFLAAAERPLIVTPWRGIVLCDLEEWPAEQVVRVLAPMGLIFDADSPWLRVSACAGRPGCAKSHTDVRADLALALAEQRLPTGGREHWAGCERRCGRPTGSVADVVAQPDGDYRVGP
jgi:precorrin-3B synthase